MTDQPAVLNKSILRMTSLLTVLVLLAGLFSQIRWLALLLCIDSLIRGFAPFAFSPLYRAARAHIVLFRIKPKQADAAPRRFAAKIDAVLFALITVLAFSGLRTAAYNLTQLMVLAAGLDVFAGISLGAKLHNRLKRSR